MTNMVIADSLEALKPFAQLIETVARLRAPNGCPWDREQTHRSLRPYLIEEAYEVLDILDKLDDHSNTDSSGNQDETAALRKLHSSFKEELGDVLMQVLLHSEIAREKGVFDIFDVANTLNDKLMRRHPHVFGDVIADNADAALKTWEKQKALEKAMNQDASVLDGVPRGLPSLQRGTRVIEKVTRVGFQWKDLEGPLAKVDEELEELKTEISIYEKGHEKSVKKGLDKKVNDQIKDKISNELGDLFFSLCNLAFLLKINPEDAFRGTLTRFETRFRHVEKRLKELGKSPDQSSLQEMDIYWDEAKTIENKPIQKKQKPKAKSKGKGKGKKKAKNNGKKIKSKK